MSDLPSLPPITGSSRVRLHELQSRPHGDAVIVGRLVTGEVVELPPVGAHIIGHLRQHLTVAETARRVAHETGEDVDTKDVADFVTDLTDLGFVASVDDVDVPGPAPRRPAFAWITPKRAAWSLSPLLPWAVGILAITTVVAVAHDPSLMPGYHSLLWSPHGSLVLLVGFGVGWPLVFLHELAHLVTARASGVPARVELGTRLQFLVAQTDMSGIELAPRRHRLTAYLSGMAVNLAVACLCILAAAGPWSSQRPALQLLALLSLLPLAWQFLIFMRTDVYFVLQDLTETADLYGDGLAYARYLAHRVIPLHRSVPPDPTSDLPAAQRRVVQLYTAVLVTGTVLCLAALASVTAPADLALLVRAAHRVGPDHSLVERLDGATVLIILGGSQALWARTKWRYARHRRRNRRGD
ncbi:hypothetical protein ACIRVF_39175 [Kitasatospora sp. NPDC101157]|uniref:hypothetical protein n=1 Tax=Kitasatospora sp. NPDC101157 TaxID=3364098 RepID=UPI00382C0437